MHRARLKFIPPECAIFLVRFLLLCSLAARIWLRILASPSRDVLLLGALERTSGGGGVTEFCVASRSLEVRL